MSQSSKIFAKIFSTLAEEQVFSKNVLAQKFWEIMKQEKINPAKLKIDEILIKLDLAEKFYDPETDTEIILYDGDE